MAGIHFQESKGFTLVDSVLIFVNFKFLRYIQETNFNSEEREFWKIKAKRLSKKYDVFLFISAFILNALKKK